MDEYVMGDIRNVINEADATEQETDWARDAPGTPTMRPVDTTPSLVALEEPVQSDAEQLSLNAAYSLVLRGVLADGVVSLPERELLDAWARTHHIAPSHHEEALREMGWNLDEFEAACLPHVSVEKEAPSTAYRVRIAGFLLSANAGYVNGIAFSGMYEVAVSHVTGEVTSASLGLGDVSLSVGVVACFALGASICGMIIGKNQVNFGLALYGFVLLGVCLLLFLAALFAGHSASVHCAAMAMGMQNAMATTYSGAVVRTTHMTGIATDIGLVLGRIAGRQMRGTSYTEVGGT